ncbi:MAG: hypothetical protein M1426_01760 [Patescibacteria group bacterium]|nr:hypothetical protein [Patescibacteria group bacterium]
MNSNAVIPIIVILLVSLLVFINRSNFKRATAKNADSVNSSTTTISHNISLPQPTGTPSPSTRPLSQYNSEDFYYPNSQKIAGDGLALISLDNPQVITNWYKNKINSLRFVTTSFIQTNTNGNVLNSLVGAKGEEEVRVEISKDSNKADVTIKILLKDRENGQNT